MSIAAGKIDEQHQGTECYVWGLSKTVTEGSLWLWIRQPPGETPWDPEKLIYSAVKVMAPQKQSDIERCVWTVFTTQATPLPHHNPPTVSNAAQPISILWAATSASHPFEKQRHTAVSSQNEMSCRR